MSRPFDFIHATTTADPVVQISGSDEPHWAERRDEARRFLTS
ncbi:MAG: hypothetical protein AB1492_09155 [Bacillota bacterium]